MVNARQIVQNDLPKSGGTWIAAFFLVGLLVGYRNPAIKRLRYFLMGCVVVLFFAQALGRTQLWEESPEINSENLLVLVAPLMIIYGVSLFFLLLDQIHLPFRQLRYGIITIFGLVVCLPTWFALLPPKTSPVVYPPHHPPRIQLFAAWMKPTEASMSDTPWAVAWYGRRQCMWLTLDVKNDFFEIHDYRKPVSVLYLTPTTMAKTESRLLIEPIRDREEGWESFVVKCLIQGQVPVDFPLRRAPQGWLPDQLLLAEWERWRTTTPVK